MSYTTTIAELLNSNNAIPEQQSMLNKISEGIDYAWNNWDKDIVEAYYVGENPSSVNVEFIKDYINNQDFNTDGFDEDYLK